MSSTVSCKHAFFKTEALDPVLQLIERDRTSSSFECENKLAGYHLMPLSLVVDVWVFLSRPFDYFDRRSCNLFSLWWICRFDKRSFNQVLRVQFITFQCSFKTMINISSNHRKNVTIKNRYRQYGTGLQYGKITIYLVKEIRICGSMVAR